MSNILSAEDVGRVLSMLDASDLCATFGLSEKTQQKVLDSVPALCASHEALRNTLLDFTTYNTELMKRAAVQARRIEALEAGLREVEGRESEVCPYRGWGPRGDPRPGWWAFCRRCDEITFLGDGEAAVATVRAHTPECIYALLVTPTPDAEKEG